MRGAGSVLSRLRAARIESNAGYALIEVIVSAAVLAMVAVAVLAGVDGAQRSTGREKARSVAASLAEQDQERLRAMPVEQLATYAPETRVVPVGGASYTVFSKIEWARDDTGGTVSCTADKRDADYLHVTTTVTSNVVGTSVKPVVIDSLIAPNIEYSSTHGTLAVMLTDRDGDPLVGKMVSISGPQAATGQTNTSGCALFENIASGTYTVTLNTPGLVNHFGKTNVTLSVDVPASQLTLVAQEYDVPGTVTATVRTYKPGSTTAQIDSVANKISATNGLETSLLVAFNPTSGPPGRDFSGGALFPFLNSPYGFFTGTCRYGDPSKYTNGYFTAASNGAATLDPGGSAAITVLQPAFNLRVMSRYYTATPSVVPDGMVVRVYPNPTADDSCADQTFDLKTFTTTAGGSTGVVGRSQLATDTTYVEAGAPFGTYDICVQDYNGSGSYRHWRYPDDLTGTPALAPYDMRKLATPAAAQTKLPPTGYIANWTSGQCPAT
jgi:type II secretory pathway pseudopilin PulG